MTLLVTGAMGFVMSVLTRQWLEANPGERPVTLDSSDLDQAAKDYFSPVAPVVPPEQAEIVEDDTQRDGMWGAYDLARIQRDTAWKPRPVRQAFHACIDWLAASRKAADGGR